MEVERPPGVVAMNRLLAVLTAGGEKQDSGPITLTRAEMPAAQ